MLQSVFNRPSLRAVSFRFADYTAKWTREDPVSGKGQARYSLLHTEAVIRPDTGQEPASDDCYGCRVRMGSGFRSNIATIKATGSSHRPPIEPIDAPGRIGPQYYLVP